MFHFCALSQVNNSPSLKWLSIRDTIEWTKISHLKSPKVGDGLITLIKVDPKNFSVDVMEYKRNNIYQTAQFWTDSFKYNIVINAGMYNLKNKKFHRFYMKNKGLINNEILNDNVRSIMAFDPVKDGIDNFSMFDLENTSFDSISNNYNTLIQGYRLFDYKGQPVYWENNTQYCSMVVIAQDMDGFVYFISSRSPLTQNQMIDNLVSMKLNLKGAMYLEGGQKASLVVSYKGFSLKEMGSYVSIFHPYDDNWKLQNSPNFIGFKLLEK